MRSPACKYSFDDLHRACFGRALSKKEKQSLYALAQDKRNEVVGEWAERAKWVTEDIIGDDGVTYRSFMPRMR